jgi:hypothetical protein
MYRPVQLNPAWIKLEVCSIVGSEPQLSTQIMPHICKCIGLDVHEETIAVAVADSNSNEIRFVDEIVNTSKAINKLVKQLKLFDAALSFCYEAGPNSDTDRNSNTQAKVSNNFCAGI